MKLTYKKILSISCVGVCALGAFNAQVNAKVIDKVTGSIEKNNQNGAVSQQKIEAIQTETDTLFEQYLRLQSELDQLNVNNQYSQNLIDDQLSKLTKLETQLGSIDETNSALIPLMQQMIKTLKLFVELDAPFLIEKRIETVAKLEGFFKQSNLSIAQKYQQILQAYVIESQYGQTIETYQGKLDIDGQVLTVQFFRMGRLALYYRTIDQKNAYVWDNAKKVWSALNNSHMFSLDNAMKMAQNKVTPALISLPVPWDSVSKDNTLQESEL